MLSVLQKCGENVTNERIKKGVFCSVEMLKTEWIPVSERVKTPKKKKKKLSSLTGKFLYLIAELICKQRQGTFAIF